MNLMRKALLGLLALTALCTSTAVWAANSPEDPVPLPTDNRIVTFTYSPDAVYTILAEPGDATHIQLGDDEGVIERPAFGDSIEWKVSGGPRNLYVKPVRAGIMTTMTLVTNKHVYEFELRASPAGGKFYQKVKFFYPDEENAVKLRAENQASQFIAEKTRLNDQVIAPSEDPTHFHYGYSITGDAPFRPLEVLDNGTKTFIRLPAVQDQPVLFLKGKDGNLELVDSHIRGDNFIVMDRIADAFVLKLNDQEVTITSDRTSKSWWSRVAPSSSTASAH